MRGQSRPPWLVSCDTYQQKDCRLLELGGKMLETSTNRRRIDGMPV
jgi:hypothetical protein